MKIKYYGHSCFLIDDLLIDPFLKDSPFSIELSKIKCSIICITHEHFDHTAGALEIAKQNNAVIVAMNEVSEEIEKNGVMTEKLNLGGKIRSGDWQIKMVPAVHSTGKSLAAGYILKKGNKAIYHAGDTALFGDMRLIGDESIDIAMLPIGGKFTMDIDDALKAVELIRPKIVIPMHYNTFPQIKADAEDFKARCKIPVYIFKLEEEKNF